MRKILLLFLMGALLPVVANADRVVIEGICYNLVTKLKQAEVTSKPSGEYTGNINIPASVVYDDIEYSVTKIGNSAFSGCRNLNSVTIPESVTIIGSSAFRDCSGGVLGAGGLTSVTIPNGVTIIGPSAFQGCTHLTSVSIPESLTTIGSSAFHDCTKLASVTIPESVTTIGSSAFNYCSQLTFINIPNSVTSIGDETFRECRALTTVTIPDSLTTIGKSAFQGCSSLTSVNIPNSVKTIGFSAFYGCSSLRSVLIADLEAWCNISFDDTPFNYAHHLYLNDEEITDLVIPNTVTRIGKAAFICCSYLTAVTIPNSVTSIGNSAFSSCGHLTTVTIPNSVTRIGEYAFRGCSLTSVTIPNGVTSISDWAFGDCRGLTSITIPENVTSIGNHAFRECTKLTTVTIPNSVKSIGVYAFGYCSELTDVYCYAKKVPNINSNTFYNSYIEYATLHVPNSALNTYKSTEPWSKFGNFDPISGYKVIYIVDEEEYKVVEYEVGDLIISEPAPTKEGYTFSGWSEIPETMPAQDVTVTGSFTINKYILTYMVDGEEYKSYEIEYGTPLTVEQEPIKEGCSFSGWSEIPETMPAHDVTVTGAFTINKYKLSFTIDGENYKSYEVEFGANITPETFPEKEGYTFSGWSEIPETMPAHDVTVTGSFIVNKYKISYIIDFEEYRTYEVEYGATITPETEPTKEDYTFSGWSEIPETMPAHDVVVTGTFIMNYPNGQCETPTISYANGKLRYECKTAGAEFETTITDDDIKTHIGSEVTLTATYTISVIARAEGYKPSESATATLCWIDVEPYAEGTKEAEDKVTEVRATPVLIHAEGNTISVQGAAEGTDISVYNTAGIKLKSAIANKGTTTLNTQLPSGSTAIVKIGDKVVKVLVK